MMPKLNDHNDRIEGREVMTDELCDCDGGKPCPFGRVGSQCRCPLEAIANHMGCRIEDALETLHEWQRSWRPRQETTRQDYRLASSVTSTEGLAWERVLRDALSRAREPRDWLMQAVFDALAEIDSLREQILKTQLMAVDLTTQLRVNREQAQQYREACKTQARVWDDKDLSEDDRFALQAIAKRLIRDALTRQVF